MSAAAWMDTHSVAEINRENGYRVRFPASGSQTDEQQSLASRYQARPALANTSEEAMTDFNAAKELGYAQAMVEVAMLISQHVRRRTLDAETLMVLMDEIRKVQDAHKSEAA